MKVIEKAAQGFGWRKGQKAPQGRGYGFAFARYKNLAAYCAIATEIEINRETGRPHLVRAVAAVDSGQVVNPDGLINQVEGRNHPVDELDVRRLRLPSTATPHHQYRLADLSDPAVRRRSGKHRGPHHQPARAAFPRQR